ncbi:ferric reductase like transmembrane component-domain-containing protein [Rhexocercosporidium sp. MPI-PUGE-AT-0058]|nr:ferric reductase like transmembrane component-domain-containing protein [Rhexocercosporidium sp. MPI-PUGE-AT-0058]
MSSSLRRCLAVMALANLVSGAAPPAPTGAAAVAATKESAKANALNNDFYNYLFIICGSLIVVMIVWRLSTELVKYVRQLTSLSNETQSYFVTPSDRFASFKKHLLYAPIFSKRHNREFQMSSAVNMGTLPTRLQLAFLIGYFGTNIAFCVVSINWDLAYGDTLKQLRNRTGILAVVNMIPLFIMAGRNNILINWLNISFDTFNLLHRWFGRIVVLEALTHTLAWMLSTVARGGWSAVQAAITGTPFITYGFIATVAFVTISIQASSIFRHAFYETFKYLHIALAISSIIGLWYHLKLAEVPQLKLLYGVIGIWAAERGMRLIKLVWRNGTGSKALVEALPGNAVRVTVDMPRPWTFKAGQHAYLYMPSVGLFTSHPFSVAWSEEAENLEGEKLAMNRQDILSMKKTTMSYVIRERTGFTKKLFKKAEGSPDGKFYTNCFTEGPYGGKHMMTSYGTVMLVAGGVGITHQVPHVRNLVAGYANGSVAARKIVLVWIIQSPEHLEWIRPWMTSILAMDKRRDVLRIMLFISRPRSTKEIHSPSATVQMFPGRPNIETLMDLEIENQVGAMGVSVCGSGALSDDVRSAVRARQHVTNIDFVEEAFSW